MCIRDSSTTLNIRALSLDDNYVDFLNMSWLMFKDGTKKKLYFSSCFAENDSVICSARSTKKIFIVKIHLENEWKIDILYRMDPHYTLNNLRISPTSYLSDKFFAIILQLNNVPERLPFLSHDKKWPLISIYKLNKETKKGEIYGVLFWEDLNLEGTGSIFYLKDVLMLQDPSGKVKCVLSCVMSSNKEPTYPTRLRIFEFEISTYRIKYNLSSLRYLSLIHI